MVKKKKQIRKQTPNESLEKISKIFGLVFEICIREMAQKIEISTTAIEKNIDNLKNKGLLKREGSTKGGNWVLSY